MTSFQTFTVSVLILAPTQDVAALLPQKLGEIVSPRADNPKPDKRLAPPLANPRLP